MTEYIVNIQSIEPVTHDVKRFRLDKPGDYSFVPGQATDVSINKPGWKDELRPFTFTSLNEDPFLEFTIKRYSDHDGVTNQLHQLSPGDQLILRDVWGAIEYKGPGYFIAGGAGITPFIAILRQLKKDGSTNGNTLYFSNKTSGDIIYEEELKSILGDGAHFLLTRENKPGYISSRIDKSFFESIRPDYSKHFYVCGPDPMISDISEALAGLGATADSIVFEK
jgi:ferredoxin-NADP reductase